MVRRVARAAQESRKGSFRRKPSSASRAARRRGVSRQRRGRRSRADADWFLSNKEAFLTRWGEGFHAPDEHFFVSLLKSRGRPYRFPGRRYFAAHADELLCARSGRRQRSNAAKIIQDGLRLIERGRRRYLREPTTFADWASEARFPDLVAPGNARPRVFSRVDAARAAALRAEGFLFLRKVDGASLVDVDV